MARRRQDATRQASRRRAARAAEREVLTWEDDPGEPGVTLKPLPRPAPKLNQPPLRVAISGRAPAAKTYTPGTPEFRYWVTAEALGRGADLWARLLPDGVKWVASVGRDLRVDLDVSEELNAYYTRRGLEFCHAIVAGTTVYSGESADIVCHELGHAVLDALRPQLWDASAIEVAAFHESFGDMSAILAHLQLRSVREDVLVATDGRLWRASRVSRLAEQLGWAIRQTAPDAVDWDSLRNAANTLFYRDPESLPPSAPASALSSAPHSFSRVFTGAFLRSLAGMFALDDKRSEDGLLRVSEELGALLVAGIEASPIVPSYYSQVAAHMIEADRDRFAGRYRDALGSAFIRHGVLSLEAAAAVGATVSPLERRGIVGAATRRAPASLEPVALAAAPLGLTSELVVDACSETKRYGVAGASPNVGSVEPPAHDRAARSFVEDLFRRGRIEVGEEAAAGGAIASPLSHKTHELRREGEALRLVRRSFDCGFSVDAWV